MRQDKQFKNQVLPLTDKLFRLALSITRNKQDAEDVVQDTMLNVWQKRNEWEGITNLEGYCLRATRNNALDKIALKDNTLERIPEYFEVQDTNQTDALEMDEQMNLLRKSMDRLNEKQRTIFQLRDIEGLSYKEIEGIMNISEEQVKVNLFRSRQKIKEYFKSADNK